MRSISHVQSKRREMIQRRLAREATEREVIRRQLEASNEAARDSRQVLEEQRKARRRQSIALNNEILQRFRARDEQEKHEQQRAKMEDLALKELDRHAIQESNAKELRARRQSILGRAAIARMHKSMTMDASAQKHAEMQTIFDTRRTAWLNEQAAIQREENLARESLAGRLANHRAQREQSGLERENTHVSRVEELQRKASEAQDVKKALDAEKKRDRQSLSARLDKWRRDKEQQKLTDAQRIHAEAITRELEAQARNDVDQYRLEQRKQRRESLAMRVNAAKQDRDWERGQVQMLAIALEEERAAAEEDRRHLHHAKNAERDAARESLLHRAEKASADRTFDEEEAFQAQEREREELQLRKQDLDDVLAAKEAQRARDRQSLAERLTVQREQKERELETHFAALSSLHADLLTRAADAKDVEAYRKQDQQRRRQSVAMRLDSWRALKQAELAEEHRQEVILEEERRIKAQDLADLEAAREAMKDAEIRDRMLGSFAF